MPQEAQAVWHVLIESQQVRAVCSSIAYSVEAAAALAAAATAVLLRLV